MRFLVKATVPVDTGNDLIRAARLGPTIESILSDLKPEAAYFTAVGGDRTAYLVVDMRDASEMPKVAEPLFLAFDANVEFHPVMTVEDLVKAGPAIESAVEKYG